MLEYLKSIESVMTLLEIVTNPFVNKISSNFRIKFKKHNYLEGQGKN
jgi:hypothetical protein